MLRLCTAANLPEAHLLLHQLVHAGIEARVLKRYVPDVIENPMPNVNSILRKGEGAEVA